MTKINSSPERHTFQLDGAKRRAEEDGKEIPENYIALWKSATEQDAANLANPAWQIDNMEYDLRTSELIIEKCKDKIYAQHLYASMCNNEFTKNDVWPILSDKRWSCSWRSAGGIVADIRQEGDYIDWYCSGIRNNEDLSDDDLKQLSSEEQENYLESKALVSESVVTDEIRQDLLSIGWLVVDSDNLDY
jgi:hypothetical protein